MKDLFTLLIAALLSISAHAATLTDAEALALTAKIDQMYAMYDRGDPKALIAETHPSLYPFAGGEAQYEAALTEGFAHAAKLGIKFTKSENGAPSRIYSAGTEEVCFVPRVSIMEGGGFRRKNTTFMVAIRKVGGSEWKFLDGSGFRKNADLIYTLLPELERGITFPPLAMEKL